MAQQVFYRASVTTYMNGERDEQCHGLYSTLEKCKEVVAKKMLKAIQDLYGDNQGYEVVFNNLNFATHCSGLDHVTGVAYYMVVDAEPVDLTV